MYLPKMVRNCPLREIFKVDDNALNAAAAVQKLDMKITYNDILFLFRSTKGIPPI